MLPFCVHGQSQDTHLDSGFVNPISLMWVFLDVIRATLAPMVNNVTHKLSIILALNTTLITNSSCFLFKTKPLLFLSPLYQ
jgi:hypothetical protein